MMKKNEVSKGSNSFQYRKILNHILLNFKNNFNQNEALSGKIIIPPCSFLVKLKKVSIDQALIFLDIKF